MGVNALLSRGHNLVGRDSDGADLFLRAGIFTDLIFIESGALK